MKSKINFDYLFTFYAVANKKSFTAAAKELQKAKSAISRQVSLLEKYFGEPLIRRKGSSFALTEKGGQIFEKTQKIILELKTFEAEVKQTSYNLRVSSTHALLSTWLSTFLHKFVEKHPSWTFELFASVEPIEVALQEADICIRPYCVPSSHYSQIFLRKWTLRLYASKIYLEKYGTPLSIEQLQMHKILIFLEKNQFYGHTYANWPLFKHSKFNQPRESIIQTNSLHAMHNLIVNGVGIGALAEDSPLHKQSELVPILPEQLFEDIEVYLIIPNVLLMDEKVVIFRNFLQSVGGLCEV